MTKYSRQRESIQRCLMGRSDHPTAETIYLCIKEEYPNISLGTVYRNLALLAEQGEILKLSTGEGPERFDARTDPHSHVQCNVCGRVMDLDFVPDVNLDAMAAEHFAGTIDSHMIFFYGTCPDCLHNKLLS